MEDFIKLLNSILPISKEEQKFIEKHIKKETIAKGEIYCAEGKVCKKIGFVVSGIFKCVRINADDNEYIPYFINKGHFSVALESFLNESISEEYIEALTECIVVTIPKNIYDMFEEEVGNFSKIMSKIKDKALIEKDKLKSELLVLDAETRYAKLLENQPSVIQYVSQKNIAQFLGITQYTLSRIRSKK